MRTTRHCCIVYVLCIGLLFGGCSALIVRPDDTTGQKIAKVTTRVILVLPTLLWSEGLIKRAKENEAEEMLQSAQVLYFGKVCEKEGYPAGTEAQQSCILVKQGQMAPTSTGSNVGVMLSLPTPRYSTTCFSSSSGRSTTCY